MTCGGGGVPGVCGCTDDGTACGEQTCGTAVNNCGETVTCTGCTGCCDAMTNYPNATCEAGTKRTACGTGGSACQWCGTEQICCNGTCCSGCCSGDGSCMNSCIVFATSTVHNGALGGLAGADAICQERARLAGLPGTYMDWLSDSTQSPSTRFRPLVRPYVSLNGTIADGWGDLIDGDLDIPIVTTERGLGTTAPKAWTYTLPDGRAGGLLAEPSANCFDWTANGGWGNAGLVGDIDEWTFAQDGLTSCGDELHLYCFQQS